MSRTPGPINEQKYFKLNVMDKTLKLWNRDLAATLNFRHSLMSPRENGTCPERFCKLSKK
ncbi:hypothetical protein BDF14DRAFT_1779372 [Spinellus fusiger]|nr:hypothetical protein BDF14DRAFT_1779372 [Spinellus fusiger]